MNQMAAGSGMENVGEWGGRQCGRDHSMFCYWEEPAYVRCKATRYAQRERERHKEVYLYYQNMQQLQMNNNLYKRLQSHFI